MAENNAQAHGGGSVEGREVDPTPGRGGWKDAEVLPATDGPLQVRAGPGEQTAVPAGSVPAAGAAGDVVVSPQPGAGGSSNQAGKIGVSHRPGTARGSRAFGRGK
jgi:hypothetical protein